MRFQGLGKDSSENYQLSLDPKNIYYFHSVQFNFAIIAFDN